MTIRTITRWTAAAALSGVVFFAGCFVAGELEPAEAAVTPAQTACQAFAAWDASPTAANLDTLIIDTAALGTSYEKADFLQTGADASSPSPKAATYVAKDKIYDQDDCS